MSAEQPGGMTDEQRQRWKETRLFPIERWSTGDGSTPLVCPMPDRDVLRKIALSIPAHIQASGWYAVAKRDGFQSVYGDDFTGMGRQAIATVPSGKHYFGWLPEFIAAACPRTVIRLLDRISELEQKLADAGPQNAPTARSWRQMSTAPRDGTFIRLLVEFDEHQLEDSDEPQHTIGSNSFDNTRVDEWQFVGWRWTHDHFTDGKGKPIGWLPF